MAKYIKIKTYPHKLGDQTITLDCSTIKEEDIFVKPYKVVVGNRVVHDWDELLKIIDSTPDEDILEIDRFRPIVGG